MYGVVLQRISGWLAELKVEVQSTMTTNCISRRNTQCVVMVECTSIFNFCQSTWNPLYCKQGTRPPSQLCVYLHHVWYYYIHSPASNGLSHAAMFRWWYTHRVTVVQRKELVWLASTLIIDQQVPSMYIWKHTFIRSAMITLTGRNTPS